MLTAEEAEAASSCTECGGAIPCVRLYCGRPPEKGWPVDSDGDCGARMCGEGCAATHAEKHVEKGKAAAERLDAKLRRRRETGWR